MVKKLMLLCLSIIWLNAFAIDLNPNHPNRYVVQHGDTLWHIAKLFLKNPWDWPKVWVKNTGISNPNYIYPGDVLILRKINGQPKVIATHKDQSQANKTIILQPQLRQEKNTDAILTIPLEYLKPFLTRDRIFTEAEFAKAPYVLALSHQDRIQAATGDHIFVRGLANADTTIYSVYKKGEAYHDKKDEDKIIAHQAIYAGEAQLLKFADPAIFNVIESRREINKGDRLFPRETLLPPHFLPQASKKMITGNIIGLTNGLTQIGQFNVVTVDLGSKQGVHPGYVFNIYVAGQRVTDKFAKGAPVSVKLPDHKVGVLMIFKVYGSISYALVMKATQAFEVGAEIKSI